MGAMCSKVKYLPKFSCSYRFKFSKIAYNMKADGKLIHTIVLFGNGFGDLNKNMSLCCSS